MTSEKSPIDVFLIRSLLSEQFPQWQNLPLVLIPGDGTDNVIYKLGEDKCIRFSCAPEITAKVRGQYSFLKEMPPLPLFIPTLLVEARASKLYNGYWSVWSWLKGRDAFVSPPQDLCQAARDLATFLKTVHQARPPKGLHLAYRGCPLSFREEAVQKAVTAISDRMRFEKDVMRMWEDALCTPAWDKDLVWVHGDLLPSNILTAQGRLSGVIDWDLMGVGDPACDLIPAWSLFESKSRAVFRDCLEIDEFTWRRARGWALAIALVILPYYWETNPTLVSVAKKILKTVLEDDVF